MLLKSLQTFLTNVKRHQIPRLAATMSYYSIFSLIPLLLLLLLLSQIFLQDTQTLESAIAYATNIIGEEYQVMIERILNEFSLEAQENTGKRMLTLGLIIFAAVGVFIQLQASLNQIWGITIEKKWLLLHLKKRLRGICVIITVFAFLFALSVSNVVLGILFEQISNYIALWDLAIQTIRYSFLFVMFSLLLALIHKFLPDIKIPWRLALIGWALSTIMFFVGSLPLSWYFQQDNLFSSYGIIGSVLVLLTFLYYLWLIFFLSAEFTRFAGKHMQLETETPEYATKPSPTT